MKQVFFTSLYFVLLIACWLSATTVVSCRSPRAAHTAINPQDTVKYWAAAGTGIDKLPDSVFAYHNLAYLYLGPEDLMIYPPISATAEAMNRFTDLPPNICSLKRLKVLDLTYNQLTKIPDLSCLDSLAILNISFNKAIRIAQPENIATVKQMKSLQLLFVAGTDYTAESLAKLEKECNGLRVMIRYESYFKYLDSLQRTIFNK